MLAPICQSYSILPFTSIMPLEVNAYLFFLANQCFIFFPFFFSSNHFMFGEVFEEQSCSLGVAGGERGWAGRQHLRANLKPGGKRRAVTSAVQAKNKETKTFFFFFLL